MIRVRKLPFPVNEDLMFNGERTTSLVNYQLFPSQEIFYQTGNNLKFVGDWNKFQVTIPIGDVILDHLLLSNSADKKFGQSSLYPIMTIVYPQVNPVYKCLPILHKPGITKIHNLLNPSSRPHYFHFLAEYILEYILQDTDLMNICQDYSGDVLESILEPQFNAMSYFHNEGQGDILPRVNSIIHEILDTFQAGQRHGDFPLSGVLEEILSPLFPKIPQEIQLHPFSRKILLQEELTPEDIVTSVKMDPIEQDEIHELEDMIQKRREMADIDMDDVGFYPELLDLYQTLLNSGYTDVFLEYEKLDGEWVPTPECECFNAYRSYPSTDTSQSEGFMSSTDKAKLDEIIFGTRDYTHVVPPVPDSKLENMSASALKGCVSTSNRDRENEYGFVLEVEGIISSSQFLRDVADDLTSLEHNSMTPPTGESSFGEITRIEIIITNASACVIVYSWGLSCATFIDYTVAALISSSIVSH